MTRQALATGLVALAAILTFSVAAGSVAAPDFRGDEDPSGMDVDENADPTSVLPPTFEERCLFCGDGINGAIGQYLPALSDTNLALIAAAAALALGALWHTAGGGEPPDAEAEDDETEVAPAGATPEGVAPGPEAFDDPPPTNAVYRAYLRLVEQVDPGRPAAMTPGETATRAREVGLEGDAVDAVRRLFEEVRYGEAPPSEARERRAEAAAERIAADESADDDATDQETSAAADDDPDGGAADEDSDSTARGDAR